MEGLYDPDTTGKPLAAIAADLTDRLWAVVPPEALLNRFERSRPLLAQRLKEDHFQRILLAYNSAEEAEGITELQSRLDCVRDRIGDLPIVFSTPGLNPNVLRRNVAGDHLAPNWGQWSFEPVGAGWGCNPEQLAQLATRMAESARPELREADPNGAALAALMFEFLRLHQLEKFRSAIKLVPTALSILDAFESSADPQTRVGGNAG